MRSSGATTGPSTRPHWASGSSSTSGYDLNDPLGARNQGIRFVEGIQQRIADQFGERPAFWAVVLGAVIVSAIVVISVGRRRLLPSEGTRAGETNAEDEVAGVG